MLIPAFHPESLEILTCFGRSSDLPLHLKAFPLYTLQKQVTVAKISDNDGDYSSGYCPGFSPGSLFDKQHKMLFITKTNPKILIISLEGLNFIVIY